MTQDGRKIKTSIRINAELWRKFRWDVRSKNLRTCSVLEALVTAYVYGGAMVPGLGRPQTVNITINRVINVPDSQKGVEARLRTTTPNPVRRKWSPKRIPAWARCIGCKHHDIYKEYNRLAQSLLLFHSCARRGAVIQDLPKETLRSCELREPR